MPDILIIGGGAAGFFAAIRCAELYPDAQVALLERGKELLGKVKISGGGRCNVTHACFVPKDLIKNYPRGSKELLGPFTRFACGDTMEWFESRGVALKIEDDGRVFPESDSSQSIIDCLLDAARQAGVRILLHHRIDDILPPAQAGEPWQINTSEGPLSADRILIATGSNTRIWEQLAALGHSIVPPVPSLFTFNIKDPALAALPGLSVPQADVSIPGTDLAASGPLLITHWGLSGPAILRLSAWGARILAGKQYRFNLRVNWTGLSIPDIEEELEWLRQQYGKRQAAAHPQFDIPTRLWRALCLSAWGERQLDSKWGDLNKGMRDKLINRLAASEYSVNGKSTFKEEFVTAGGVDLREINFKTFESKLHPGLFFAGEVLDIDAITGGFNFQAAWTGGWIAGEAMGAF
ncbi:MAG TPA: NAD(P)/FAD-dependent oxidoreductase [Saprospiraceae bacterium]|nr:NAD(P)/FAD-dependent oxidoreductase [Saprospiraceae bacterium]